LDDDELALNNNGSIKDPIKALSGELLRKKIGSDVRIRHHMARQ
jgi:hypothetical protein